MSWSGEPDAGQLRSYPLLHPGAHRLRRDAADLVAPRRGEYQVDRSPLCLNYVLDGEEVYDVGGRRVSVGAGEILLLDAGIRVHVCLPRPSPTLALCVCLPESLAAGPAFAPLAEAARGQALVVGAGASGFGAFLRQSALRLERDPGLGPRLAAGIVQRTLSDLPALAGHIAAQLARMPAAKPATRRALLQRLERARDHVERHADAPLRLQQVADAAGLSVFHLLRLFTRLYGCSPMRLHRRLRLRRCAERLAAGELTPGSAADSYGFADPSTFSRAFRRELGEAPGAYRARRNGRAKLARTAQGSRPESG